MKKLVYVLIFLIVFVFGLTFAARNPDDITINYYFGIDFELPLTLLLLVVLGVGVLLGYLFAAIGGFFDQRRRRRAHATTMLPQRASSISRNR